MSQRGGKSTTSKAPGPYVSAGLLITGSVGEGGHNYEKDVILVKMLLNEIPDVLLYDSQEQWIQQPDGSVALEAVTLVPDGIVGPATIERIKRFQTRVVGLSRPDGRIDPGKKSFQELLLRFLHTGLVLPLRTTEGRIHPQSVYTVMGGPVMFAGLQFKRGLIVNGLDGKRLILSITADETIFILLDRSGPGNGLHDLNPMRGKIGGIYAQMTEAFINEYTTYFWRHMSDVLAPMETMIETEVNLLMAIGTTMTGTAIFYAGFTLSDFIAKNQHKFKHWIAIVEAILKARRELKHYAPTLYDNLFDALFEFYKDSITPENAASLVGKIIGLGGQALLARKLNVISSAGVLILNTTLLLLHNLADSIARAEKLWKSGIHKLVAELRSLDVEVTPQEQIAIFQELRAHPKEIGHIFQRLVSEINEHMHYTN
jgi:hypothetical protein